MSSHTLVFLPEALQDIAVAMDWYDEQQTGLADRFYAQLDDKLQQILAHPYLYAVRYNEVRCVQLQNFPYLIHYYVEKKQQKITVLGIIHTSRDPREGTERL